MRRPPAATVGGFFEKLRGDVTALAPVVAAQTTGNDIIKMCITNKTMLGLCTDKEFALRVLQIMDSEDIRLHNYMMNMRNTRPMHYLAWVKDKLNDPKQLARMAELAQDYHYPSWQQNTKYGPRPDLDFGAFSDKLQGRPFRY